MQLTILRKFRIICPLFILGFLIYEPFTVSSFAADSRIGFLDLQKAVSSTKEWETDYAKFNKDFTKEKQRFKVRELKIKKMLEDLGKQRFVLDPELKSKKEDNLRKEKVDFERYIQDQNAELNKKRKEIAQKILVKMDKVIKKIGTEKKYTMILERKVVLYHDKDNDLTAAVIQAYDKVNK